jgi:3-hydroxyisobutyrate dehydrogenase-like beta-hydroxyacid dehydrogenase
MHVGFVGTGNMGFPMARNILKAGHQLTPASKANTPSLPER